MATAENALLQYEGGQNMVAMGALSDSGDRTTFTSGASLWSSRSGYAPVVRPNGVLSGGSVIPAVSLTNNLIDTTALSCNLNGVVTAVAADTDVSITRPATNVAKVCSVTVTSGGVIAVVAGTDGGSTTFSETRGAAGGPPYIAVDAIEIAQVRVTSSAAAPITASEIYSINNLHRESAIYPQWTVNRVDGEVTFIGALPAIHTGDVGKAVYASYATPIFADVELASDFKPAENTHSLSSIQVYGRTIGSSTSTLQSGSFVAYLNDGVTDPLVQSKNQNLWFKFFPDRYQSSYLLLQGKLGVSRTFPAGDQIKADCTISAEDDSTEVIA